MAYVGRIGKGGRGRPRRGADQGGGASGGDPTGDFGTHPRLLLTPTVITALQARKLANTPEYAGAVAYLNTYLPSSWATATTLSSVVDLGDGAGDTFTVTDPTGFPTTQHQVRMDLELLTVTREGSTFTIQSRGNPIQNYSAVAAHPSGCKIYYHPAGGEYTANTCTAALLHQLGDDTYLARALNGFSALMTMYAPTSLSQQLNAVRWYGYHIALAYDWLHDALTARERTVYSQLLADSISYHLYTNPKEGIGYHTDQRTLEAVVGNNIALGQIRTILAQSAATFGDNAAAQTTWDAALTKFVDWIKPGMLNGPQSEGFTPEGMEYNQTDWVQQMEILKIIETAITSTVFVDFVPYMKRLAEFLFYATKPGSTSNTTKTTGSITLGSQSMTVASSSTFTVGMDIAYGAERNTIAAISGTTWTLRKLALATYSSTQIVKYPAFFSFGDLGSTSNFDDYQINGGEPQLALTQAQAKLQELGQPTWASYIEHWLDNVAPTVWSQTSSYMAFRFFLDKNPNITAVDYTAALPLNFATENSEATGLLLGRSSWSSDCTFVGMIVGGFPTEHATGYYNSYFFQRKGVYLTRHHNAYGNFHLSPGPYPGFDIPRVGDWREFYPVASRWHNTISMNGHTAIHPVGIDPTGGTPERHGDGPATLERYFAATTYLYGRGDASDVYTNPAGWTGMGYANDYAQIFKRDFLYINALDAVVIHDRVGYTTATLSPTEWHAHFPTEPTVSSGRITVTNAGQKLVQDILLPASPAITTKNWATVNPKVVGWETTTKSGVTASSEWSLQLLQAMDDSGSPATVTLLTTTNANVLQMGTALVAGFVKDETPSLPIVYSYTGSPAHYVVGFAISTPYHITNSGGVVTIGSATGSGDTTTNSAGMLIF